MKVYIRILIVGIVATAMLATLSCKNGSTGLFESIAGETSDGSNPTDGFKYSSATNVVLIDDKYYSAMGRLWERPVTPSTWTVHAGQSANYVDSLAADSSRLYAIIRNPESTVVEIKSFDGTTWSDNLSISLQTGHYLRGLLAADGQLAATDNQILAWTEKYDSDTTTSVFSYYRLNGASFELIAGLSEVESGVPVNLLYNGSYRLCTANKLYFGGTLGTLAAVSPTLGSTALDSDLAGLAFANTKYFLTTTTGWIYTSADGISWNDWADSAAAFENADGKIFRFKAPATFSAGGSTYLLAPAINAGDSSSNITAKGYLMFTVGDTGVLEQVANYAPVSSLINYNTTLELASVSGIIAISYDSKLTLFATTYGYGLWRNVWDGTTWGSWLRESDR